MNFARALSAVGLAPASELATVTQQLAASTKSLSEMTAARDELARRLADARDEVTSSNTHNGVLHGQLELAVAQHRQLSESFDALVIESRRKDDRIAEQAEIISMQNGDLEEANALIAELQRPPQLKLLTLPERKTPAVPAGVDELLDKPTEVVLVCRLIAIVFEGDRKHWTLRRDDVQFTVPVHDKAFLERVHTGQQQFAADYLIRGRFSEVTLLRASDGEPITKRSLEEVLEVITPAVQTTFNAASPATAEAHGATS